MTFCRFIANAFSFIDIVESLDRGIVHGAPLKLRFWASAFDLQEQARERACVKFAGAAYIHVPECKAGEETLGFVPLLAKVEPR